MDAIWSAAVAGPHVRRFSDGARMWSVWEVTPELLLDMGIAHDSLSADLHDGWLCFQRGGERRRLSPLPIGWHHLNDEQLAALCRRAKVVLEHSGRVPHRSAGDPARTGREAPSADVR